MDTEKTPRPFQFDQDCFAFANELVWEYKLDPATGTMSQHPRDPRPTYSHRCFVLTRAARQFFFHACFEPALPVSDESTYRQLIRKILVRNPRVPCAAYKKLIFPGYENLQDFSAAWEKLLKIECGGAWQSYVLRSHWRMIFPISRRHQTWTANSLAESLKQNIPAIIHLVKFPALTINHSMMLFTLAETAGGWEFSAYDPNDPGRISRLMFDRANQTFSLPPNLYWAGGALDIIHIYRNWLM